MSIRKMVKAACPGKVAVEYAKSLIAYADTAPVKPWALPRPILKGLSSREARKIFWALVNNGVFIRRHGHLDFVNSYWRKEFSGKISENNSLQRRLTQARRELASVTSDLKFYRSITRTRQNRISRSK